MQRDASARCLLIFAVAVWCSLVAMTPFSPLALRVYFFSGKYIRDQAYLCTTVLYLGEDGVGEGWKDVRTGTHPELPADEVDEGGHGEEGEDEDGNKDDQANGRTVDEARGDEEGDFRSE